MRKIALIFAILLISCSEQEAAKPVSQKTAISSSTVESSSSESSSLKSANSTGVDSSRIEEVVSSSDMSSSSEMLKDFESRSSSSAVVSSSSNMESITVGGLRWAKRNMNKWTFSGSHCYQKKKQNCAKYGRLYNFETAQKICPEGWRLPSDADWNSLVNVLGEQAGKKLKAQNGWKNDDDNIGNGSDEIGFGGLPSGINFEGNFIYEGFHAFFWSSTEKDANSAYYRSLDFDSPEVYRFYNFKTAEYAVRCVQNAD